LRDKVGVHPAGIIISSLNLKEEIPLRMDRKSETIVTQWDMHDVEQIGLVKFDMLALDALDTIQQSIGFANKLLKNN